MAGKGDKRRPRQVPLKQFEDNWEKIFGKKRKEAEDKLHKKVHL